MKVAIHQPDFLPYLGFFRKLAQCDLFIVYDEARFNKRVFQHRNQIVLGGQATYLSIPIAKMYKSTSDRPAARLKEVKLEDNSFRQKHLARIRTAYERSPHYKAFYPKLESAFLEAETTLAEFNYGLLESMVQFLEIPTPLRRSSELGLDFSNIHSNEANIAMLQAVGAKTYLSGAGAQGYMDEPAYLEAGFKLEYLPRVSRTYPQGTQAFIQNMSLIDAIFWTGPEAKELLQ